MPKNTVNDWDVSPDNNTDVGGVSIAEGCPPGNINNALRVMMAQIKSYATSVTASLSLKANTADVTALTTNAAPPGLIDDFMRTSVPAGWVKASGSIGNAASGAPTRANADCLNLFTVLWTDFSNVDLPIQTSAGAATVRGASALDDFNAGKRMPLFDLRTLFRRAPDDGLGFDTALVPGLIQGDLIKSHTHTGGTSLAGDHTHAFGLGSINGGAFTIASGTNGAQAAAQSTGPAGSHSHSFVTDGTGGAENRPRSFVALVCVKL